MSTTEAATTTLAELALERLEAERDRGYPDATHTMRFPVTAGFNGPDERHRGDVFTRAIIADALCDARDAGLADVNDVLAEECEYLLSQRAHSTAGGWSYFPTLPELPPDTDVLAQVIQVLARCDRVDLAHAELPLAAVLADVREDGALGTWILPRVDRTPLDRRQALFVQRAWGDTSDPEVNANLLYALTLWDANRFAEQIGNGTAYIRDSQRQDGAWQATWYAGAYYGTYACSRFLARVGLRSPLERVGSFLARTRRGDGGWGRRTFDQLSTCMALCTAGLVGGMDTEADVDRLIRSVVGHGWKASPFIVMNVGRAQGRTGPVLAFGSSSIAAAYGLKAVVAQSKRKEEE